MTAVDISIMRSQTTAASPSSILWYGVAITARSLLALGIWIVCSSVSVIAQQPWRCWIRGDPRRHRQQSSWQARDLALGGTTLAIGSPRAAGDLSLIRSSGTIASTTVHRTMPSDREEYRHWLDALESYTP